MSKERPVYFISGHLDLTQEEFDLHYAPKIDKAIECLGEAWVSFVVGDAAGCDTMAQRYLLFKHVNVTVFHMLTSPRNFTDDSGVVFEKRGGYKSDEERDAAMTQASDFDIAWVRNGSKRKSGTAKNLKRRLTHQRDLRIRERENWPKVTIDAVEEYPVYSMSLPGEWDLKQEEERVKRNAELVANPEYENVPYRGTLRVMPRPSQLVPVPMELLVRYHANNLEAALIEQEILKYKAEHERLSEEMLKV